MTPLRVALIATLIGAPLGAQYQSVTDLFTFSASLFGSVPMGEFREHENGGGGADLSVGFQAFRDKPLVLRAQFGGLLYDGASAWGYQDVCDEQGACWTEVVQYKARNHSMMTLSAGPELMATSGSWRPYAFALAGYTWFNSWANLKPESPSGPDPDSDHLFSSRNVSTTYGLGVRWIASTSGRDVGFEFGSSFVRNAKARYLTESGVTTGADGSFTIVPRNGAANVLSFHAGVWIGPRTR